ncbi:MAG: endonuclease/exonuclease/phosphatase family protein [Elusimicrobiota bacterium]|nr:endonuclease/exonuclease/phosphatase family protein [Elusimicrobiota bacterium]
MARALVILLLSIALGASSRRAAAAAPEAAADLNDTFRDMWERFRGHRPPAAPPAGDASALGRLVSWNVQALGRKASKAKKDALRLTLGSALAGAGSAILAAQEVANDKGAETLSRQLPGGGRGWTMSFEDTSAAMNNAIFAGPGVTVNCSGNLELEGVRHTPHMAHVTVGSVDFTVLSVHLSYAKGDASASVAELQVIMDWVRERAAQPGADPDFIIAGDFNLPTGRGKELSVRSTDRSWGPIEDALGPGFTALVDEPTSRRGRQGSANNYDHFLVSDDFLEEELVVAGAVNTAEVELAEREAGTRASDHYPIALTFRKAGAGRDGRAVALDGTSICR